MEFDWKFSGDVYPLSVRVVYSGVSLPGSIPTPPEKEKEQHLLCARILTVTSPQEVTSIFPDVVVAAIREESQARIVQGTPSDRTITPTIPFYRISGAKPLLYHSR